MSDKKTIVFYIVLSVIVVVIALAMALWCSYAHWRPHPRRISGSGEDNLRVPPESECSSITFYSKSEDELESQSMHGPAEVGQETKFMSSLPTLPASVYIRDFQKR
ncbi:hypothetical protein M407DRAFT_31097 [Tulasnella calospora MUT 4182]|uniref:Uncharacterized protein n=1 Tax=Tulasnella calospora MUT 4182 TaxID=1051891 RepID=A0A0C3PW74_9AGAM|nr:hypothetical protein M407DRAFT_31097 [Tulasnella calospora MUT 4182]